DVFADQAQREQLDTGEERDHEDRGGQPGRKLDAQQLLDYVPQAQEETESGHQGARYGHELQRSAAEADQAVQSNLQRSDEAVVVALSMSALVPLVLHEGLLEPNVGHEPAQKAVRLVQASQLLYHTTRHNAEVARVARDLHITEPRDHPVAELGNQALH